MLSARINGEINQIAKKATSANTQPQYNAVQIPQQYVRIWYQRFNPQSKHFFAPDHILKKLNNQKILNS